MADFPYRFSTNRFSLPSQFTLFVFSTDSIIVHIQKVLPKSFNLSGYRSFWLFSFKNNVAMFQMYEIRVRKKWTFPSKFRRKSSILECCHFQTNKARKLRHHSEDNSPNLSICLSFPYLRRYWCHCCSSRVVQNFLVLLLYTACCTLALRLLSLVRSLICLRKCPFQNL